MKNGKNPTRKQKELIGTYGLDPEDWLVTKDTAGILEIVNRASLKRLGKPKFRRLSKDI